VGSYLNSDSGGLCFSEFVQVLCEKGSWRLVDRYVPSRPAELDFSPPALGARVFGVVLGVR